MSKFSQGYKCSLKRNCSCGNILYSRYRGIVRFAGWYTPWLRTSRKWNMEYTKWQILASSTISLSKKGAARRQNNWKRGRSSKSRCVCLCRYRNQSCSPVTSTTTVPSLAVSVQQNIWNLLLFDLTFDEDVAAQASLVRITVPMFLVQPSEMKIVVCDRSVVTGGLSYPWVRWWWFRFKTPKSGISHWRLIIGIMWCACRCTSW